MLKYLLFASVLLLPAGALAQPVTVDKPVVCDRAESVVKELTEKYGEQPVWFGQAKDSRVAVLVNPQTNSWTVIQFNDKLACVLEEGEGFQLKQGLFSGKSV